jgi:cell division protein FtsX
MEKFFIDYLLSQIPVWIWPVIAVIGLVSNLFFRVVSKLPYLKQISMIGRPVSILVLLFGTFMAGGAGVNSVYQQRIKQVQAEVDLANKQSVQTKVRIKKVIVEKIKVVKQTQIKVVHDVQRDAAVIDKECKVAPQAINDLNEAAK